MTLKRRWVRFVFKLLPRDYRRNLGISLLRAHVSWLDKMGEPRDRLTVLQIIELTEDVYDYPFFKGGKYD